MFERLRDDRPNDDPVKLVVGLLSSNLNLLEQAQSALAEGFGTLTVKSPEIPFNFTDYYEKEMGPNLIRQWVGFQGLIESEQLAERLNRHGITRAARIAALDALLTTVPAPVLAKMLDRRPWRVADRSKVLGTDWRRYVALRVQS